MHYYILPYFICGPSLAAHRQCTFVLHRDWTRSENQERYQRKVATPSFEAHCTTQWFFESKTTACVFLLLQFDEFFLVRLNFFHRFWNKVVFESKWEQLVDFWRKKSVKSKCWKRWVIQNRPFETWLPSKMTEHNLYSKVNLTILFSISYWKLSIFFFGVYFFGPYWFFSWICSCQRQNLSYKFDDRTQTQLCCSKVNLTFIYPMLSLKIIDILKRNDEYFSRDLFLWPLLIFSLNSCQKNWMCLEVMHF